ncbi:MAG: hypothetical protein K6B75_08015, partial [Lachnospiraceae bacterium]|nr:hypothetical protein [Lachnospiraceae bacterium]
LYAEWRRFIALKDLLPFISFVKHEYVVKRNIQAVMAMAFFLFKGEMKVYIKAYSKLLSGDNIRKKITEFTGNRGIPKAFRHLLIQLELAFEYGDIKTENEESLFLVNLEKLRVLVMKEIVRERNRFYEMLGLTIITMIPYFMLPMLRNVGCGISESLNAFYLGPGVLVEFLCALSCVISYFFVIKEKNGVGKDYKHIKEEIREIQTVIMMERLLPGMNIRELLLDISYFTDHLKKTFERGAILYSSKGVSGISGFISEEYEKNDRLREIRSAFVHAEETGIPDAFSETENNLILNENMDEIDARLNLEKRKDMAGIYAMMPFAVCFGIYFVLPFIVTSFRELENMMEVLGGICR